MLELLKILLLITITLKVSHIIENQVRDYEEYKQHGIKCIKESNE